MIALGKEMDMEMNLNEAQKILQQYALDNYEEGGHWVYETHEAADYQEYLDEAKGSIAKAKKLVRDHWKLMLEMESNCY
jgi:hypothetical protein